MATNNPILDVLRPYIDQETNRNQLIAKAVLDPKTAKMLTLQTGVKGPVTINLLDTDVTFGDGTTCGFSEAGSVTISQRQIVPATMKVNLEFCEKNLLGTYAQTNVMIEAGREELPFEEKLMETISKKVQNKLETMVWQGDSDDTDEVQFDGLLKIITDEDSTSVAVEAQATEYATVRALYAAIPNEAFGDDLVIFAAPSHFRAWIQELVDENQYHWTPSDVQGEYTIPGTGVKVIEVPGLEGADNYYVAGRRSNLFYGVDIENAADTIKVVYDEVKETFLIKMLFNAGVQVAYPEFVAYVKVTEPEPTLNPGD